MLSRSAVLHELYNWGLVLHLGKEPGLGVKSVWPAGAGGEYILDVDGAWRVAIYLAKWESSGSAEVVEAVKVLEVAYKKSAKETRSMSLVAEKAGMKRSTAQRRYNMAVETMQHCYSLGEQLPDEYPDVLLSRCIKQ